MPRKINFRLLVSFDWNMKFLLPDKSDYVILEVFLSAFFQQVIAIGELLESETNSTTDNQIAVDLQCKHTDKDLGLFEFQFFHQLDFFHRLIYGVARVLAVRLKEGGLLQGCKDCCLFGVFRFGMRIALCVPWQNTILWYAPAGFATN